jgi:methenyltetrahydromethanopterin cyclohydrolase
MVEIKVNELAFRVAEKILKDPERLGVVVKKLQNGATVIDCGVDAKGGFEVGRLVTEICLGGLGNAQLTHVNFEDLALPAVRVSTDWPAVATLCIQAGYPLLPDEKPRIICSGPARALARKPNDLFDFLDFHDKSKVGVIVLQMDELPSAETAEAIAAQCKIEPSCLYMFVTPSRSIAGATQIAGRAIEDVAFTMREVLRYDVRKIRQMIGLAPIVPVCEAADTKVFPDDFLSYGGTVYLTVESGDEDLDKLTKELVFEATSIYGRTFAELLKETHFDFKRIPGYPGIFRPAQVLVNDLKSGKIHRAGNTNPYMIRKCLGLAEPQHSSINRI